MAKSHPYISGPGNISHMVNHLRKSFPASVNSETVKKLGLASNNESFVINALQFVGVIDNEGKKSTEAKTVFSNHKDDDFQKAFGTLVEKAYSGLFDLHGEDSWDLSKDDLMTFFRRTDDTSEIIGRRQANTFEIFAALSGHGDIPTKKAATSGKAASQTKTKSKAKAAAKKQVISQNSNDGETPGNQQILQRDFGLSVRVEINLPADGTKETYDNIFKSIRENLMND